MGNRCESRKVVKINGIFVLPIIQSNVPMLNNLSYEVGYPYFKRYYYLSHFD